MNILNLKPFKNVLWQAHIMIPLINSLMVASVYIIVGMSVNRFIGIYDPLRFKKFHTLKNARLCIGFSFFLSFVLHLPNCFRNKVFMSKSCSSKNSSSLHLHQHLNVDAPEALSDCGWQSSQNLDVAEASAFMAYRVACQILVRLGPIVVLAILNILVVHKYRTIAVELEVSTARLSARPAISTLLSPGSDEQKRL